ncbi:unnamed protein product [Arctia plantaginis]|uniref:Uncharacterized protein n=1 Tax=Arctia plantaginis TaxID=874455 RepID=A0A8S0ZSW7_ARCPL|nr:unnamed protein product [Arctia plantaginis]CAB3236204.1 unnamed protein product [Arctia plantaginis]
MPTTRKKIIKTVYKDENSDEEEGGDFSDSGSEAIISDVSSSEDDIISESSSPEEEFDNEESFNKSKRKYPEKKSKLARIFSKKTNKQMSGCDVSENHPVFSIKDLTEADKLLPPILNLSESDSSDEESPQTLNRSSFTSFQQTDQDNESDNEVNKEYRHIWSNNDKVQDDSEEIAKKTFMELELHKSKIEETKATLQNYTLKAIEHESDVRDLLALGEDVLSTPDVSTVNKKSKIKRRKDDSDSDVEDWEEVKDTKSIPQQGIQLIVEFPDAGRKKPKKIDVEMMMKRKINRVKKEYQIYMHKVHVLCWVGHGNYVSNVLSDRVLMAAALSLIPSKERRPKNKVDMKYIEEVITCYKDHVTVKHDKNEEKFKPKSPPLKQILLHLIKTKVLTSKKYLVFIFVIILRALGLQCRVMFNFVTLPLRPPATELCSLSTKPKDQKTNQKQNSTLEETNLSETKTNMSPEKENTTNPKSNIRKAKSKKNIAQIDGNYDVFSDEEVGELNWYDYEKIMQVDGGDDGPTTRRTRSNKRHISDVDKIKDENVSPPKKPRKNLKRISLQQKFSSDENKNTNVKKKAKRGKNVVDTDKTNESIDHLRNNSSNLKELTNITSAELTEENLPSSKLSQKSTRSATRQTLSRDNEKKVTDVHKKTQKNLKTLDMKVKRNPLANDFADNNYEVVEENVSSLKVTRKSPRRNAPIRLAENAKNDVALNKRSQRRGKYVDPEVTLSTGDDSHHNNLKEPVVLASEMSEKDFSPPKIPRNSCSSLKPNTKSKEEKNTNKGFQNRKRMIITEEKYDSSDHETDDNFKSTYRNLTRSQKSKLSNDNTNKQQKNETTMEEKATSTGKKSMNQKKSFIAASVSPDNIKIPRVILTRENYKRNTSKNDEKPNPTEIPGRMTRKRLQTANVTGSKGTDTAKENLNKSKSITKKRAGVTKNNIRREDETSQISSKLSVKEELTEGSQVFRDKKPTRNNKSQIIESSKNKENITKSQTRKKSLKGKVKQESDEDADYAPIDDSKHDHHSDSDDSFKPPKFSPKLPKASHGNRRALSSTKNEHGKKNQIDIWCEVFVEELQEWVSIDIINGKVKSTEEIYANATQPVSYMVGWDNKNNLKDLTRKYVPHFNTETRKLRVDVLWWNKAVQPYLGLKTKRDKQEDEYLDKMQLEAPLPMTIGEYKNHPLYVLKRHLLKFEALYPPEPTVLGFVRGEAVYPRECVYTCHCRNTWYKKHAKVVRLGEKAYKIVKAKPRWDKINRKIITDDPPMDIFGPWQVEDFEPPVAENGIVPRNEYGNVELFKMCMLPKGTVHLKLPGLNKVAKKLNIDCALAITGFEVNSGWVRPVYDGFVVCKEFEDIITEAWADDQDEQERKELERTEIRVYGNWKRLIKGLLIRERLKNKYGFHESPTSATSKGKPKGSNQVAKKRKYK